MAVENINLTELLALIRKELGENTAAQSKYTDAQLVNYINMYGNRLPSRLDQVAREHGLSMRDGFASHYQWLTHSSVTSTTATLAFDADCYRVLELYDTTHGRSVEIIRNPHQWQMRWFRQIKNGPPQYLVLTGVNTSQVLGGTLYPTPNQNITFDYSYYRMPAEMPNSDPGNENPDALPMWHLLWLYGPLTLILAADDPSYDVYKQEEEAMVRDMAQQAGGVHN